MLLAVRSTRGSVLAAMGKYEQALELLDDDRIVMETFEDQASVLCVRARAHKALGQDKLAAECLARASIMGS